MIYLYSGGASTPLKIGEDPVKGGEVMKRKKRFGILVLSAALAAACALPAFAAEEEITVTAVGDSIGRGFGCEDVVDYSDCTQTDIRNAHHLAKPSEHAYGAVFSRLLAEETGSAVTFRNYSVDGYRANNVMEDLAANAPVYDQNDVGLADAVRQSDVVLVSLGGNDFFAFCMEAIAKSCGAETTDDLLAGFEDGSINMDGLISGFVFPLLAVAQEDATSADLRAILEKNCTESYQNDKALIDEILALNPDVQIILNGIPNPLLEETADAQAYQLLSAPLSYLLGKYNDLLIRLAQEYPDQVAYSDSDSAYAAYEGTDCPSRVRINLGDIIARLTGGEFNDETGTLDIDLLGDYLWNPQNFYVDPHPAALGQQLMAENTLKVYETLNPQGEENTEPEPAAEKPQADLNGNPTTGDAGADAAAFSVLAAACGAAILLRSRVR